MIRRVSPFGAEMAAWVLLCGSLATGIGIETDWGKRSVWPAESKEEGVPAVFEAPSVSEPFTLPPADKYLEIAMRPLFVITRRPAPDKPPQEPPKPQMQKGQFVLTGTMMIGTIKFAQLLQKNGNKPHVIQEGKSLNGIAIKAIQPGSVTLEQHGDTETLILQTSKSTSSNTSVPTAPLSAPPGVTSRPSQGITAPPPPPGPPPIGTP